MLYKKKKECIATKQNEGEFHHCNSMTTISISASIPADESLKILYANNS